MEGGYRLVEKSDRSQFWQHFLALPTEIKLQVIYNLTIPDLCALRATSQTLNSLVHSLELDLVRHWATRKLSRTAVALYPPPLADKLSLRYLLHLNRRKVLIHKLAGQLADYSLCKKTSHPLYQPLWDRLQKELCTLLLEVSYYLERYRETYQRWVAEQELKEPNACNEKSCRPSFAYDYEDTLMAIQDSFPRDRYIRIWGVFRLMIKAIGERFRTPRTSAPGFELDWSGLRRPIRRVRVAKITQMIELGGIDIAQKLLACKTYEDRLECMDSFFKGLSPTGDPAHWKDNWIALGVENPEELPVEGLIRPKHRFSMPWEIWDMWIVQRRLVREFEQDLINDGRVLDEKERWWAQKREETKIGEVLWRDTWLLTIMGLEQHDPLYKEVELVLTGYETTDYGLTEKLGFDQTLLREAGIPDPEEEGAYSDEELDNPFGLKGTRA